MRSKELPQSTDSTEFNENGDWSIGLNARSKNSLSDAEFLSNIGKGLRAVYRDVVREPLPENMTAVLDRIDRSRK
jgi:Anti-sigma factor NepR